MSTLTKLVSNVLAWISLALMAGGFILGARLGNTTHAVVPGALVLLAPTGAIFVILAILERGRSPPLAVWGLWAPSPASVL